MECGGPDVGVCSQHRARTVTTGSPGRGGGDQTGDDDQGDGRCPILEGTRVCFGIC